MIKKIKKYFYTYLFYLHFIFWGLMFTIVVIPLIETIKRLFPRAESFYFKMTFLFYRTLIWLLSVFGVLKVHPIEGEENLHDASPCIYVSNHRSMLDILIYLTKLRDTNCLIKAGPNPKRMVAIEETETERRSMPGWWLPFIMGSLKILGYIKMPESKTDMDGLRNTIAACGESLRKGRSIIIFPEGTRSRSGNLLPFLTLPFKLACDEQIPIVPLVIHNDIPIMPKGSISIDIPRRVHFHIRVLPPIMPDPKIDPQSLLVLVRKRMSAQLKEMNSNYGKMEISGDGNR
jgi:1-acyl-sn-glycerol-3-phosphate acyltransferase